MARIAVVADDLTGANDTGIKFVQKGLRSVVMLEEHPVDADVVVADADCRRDPPSQAGQKVKSAVVMLQKQNPLFWYKKIDSTLRGNLGAELETMLEMLEATLAIVCPSFPAAGRTVAGGVLLVNGVPVAETEFAKDVLTPVTSSDVAEVIQQQSEFNCARLGSEDLQLGVEHCHQRLQLFVEQDIRVVVADASSDSDLQLLGEVIGLWIHSPPLVVGSAGLADWLPSSWLETEITEKENKPVLVLAGSVNKVTRKQVDILLKEEDCFEVQLDLSSVLCQDEGYRRNLTKKLREALARGQNVVVRSADQPERVEEAFEIGEGLGLQRQQTSAAIALFFAALVRELVALDLAGLVLTGGDVAVRICKALGAVALDLLEEVSTGIPVARIKGGLAAGKLVVTKAGGFGDDQALANSVRKLKELR